MTQCSLARHECPSFACTCPDTENPIKRDCGECVVCLKAKLEAAEGAIDEGGDIILDLKAKLAAAEKERDEALKLIGQHTVGMNCGGEELWFERKLADRLAKALKLANGELAISNNGTEIDEALAAHAAARKEKP